MVPCLARHLLQIEKLRATVALSEGVDVIHVTDDVSSFGGEGFRREVPKIPAQNEPAVHVGHAGLDARSRLKSFPAFGDLDGANLSGPVVDILKQVMVNCLEMPQIEVAGWYSLGNALRHHPPLELVERLSIAEVEFVFEDAGVWIDVRIVTHSAA